MALVSLSHVSKGYDGAPLFEDVTLDVERGDKIGVIGQNGTGKSTLLKLLRGALAPDEGEVFVSRGVRIAHQAQELEGDPERTVLDLMRAIFGTAIEREARLRELEDELGRTEDQETQERLLQRYARLQDEHDAEGGWQVEQRIASVLTGLGLPEGAWSQPIRSFSGGERNVVALAAALLAEPDVLLLDEPSNHLDMDGLDWFVRFVRNTPTTVVMVSHDRHLLDAAVTRIWEVRSGRVAIWTGNYTDFEQQKAEVLALQERQFKNQERMIRRLEFQARRLRDMAKAYDDPGQAKRAKSILKRIENMDRVEKPDDGERRFHARLESGRRHGRLALALTDFSFSYGDRVIFEPSSLELEFGQRIGLVGPNGSGKTTLFREILRRGSWEDETVRLGKSVKIGEYTQFHEDSLEAGRPLLEWLQGVTGLDARPAADLLHRFLFSHDDLERAIGSLSGGEKSRLQLARLVHERVNFLLLDEPTNHLDIQAAEQLEAMLEEYDGTLLVISHDRFFLERIVDTVVEVKDRRLRLHHGGFASWWERHQAERRREPDRGGLLVLKSQAEAPRAEAAHDREEAVQQREDRKARQREERRLRRDIERLEKEVAAREARIVELEEALGAAWSGAGDPKRGAELSRELQSEKEALEVAMSSWEERALELDGLDG